MSAHLRGLFTVVLLASVLACEGGPSDGQDGVTDGGAADDDGGADADGGAVDDGGDAPLPSAFDIDIGTGRNTFVALDDGETLYLESGFQGLQHVLVSVRTPLEPGRYFADFSLVRRDDEVLVSEPSRVRIPFESDDGASGVTASLFGYQLVVAEPDEAVGFSARLRVEIEGPAGVGYDERDVVVQWAPDGWDPDR